MSGYGVGEAEMPAGFLARAVEAVMTSLAKTRVLGRSGQHAELHARQMEMSLTRRVEMFSGRLANQVWSPGEWFGLENDLASVTPVVRWEAPEGWTCLMIVIIVRRNELWALKMYLGVMDLSKEKKII